MTRYKPWLGQPHETPVTYVILLAYAVLMYPGHRAGSEHSLADWARLELGAIGPLIFLGEPWRLLSHAFVHGGILHVLMNAASLVALGPPLERWFGAPRFVLLYLVSALAGGVAGVYWHSPFAYLIGGSGALFGMMGSVLALNMRAGRHLFDFLEHGGARSFLGLLLANLVLGLVIPNISNAAHLGGLLAGFVLTFCFLEPGRLAPGRSAYAARAGWVALLASTTLYTCFPTARADYLFERMGRDNDPARRRALLQAISLLPLRDEDGEPGESKSGK